MPDASAACSKSGVLEKNHKGASFAKGSQERFFSSDGFHVSYYTDASMRKCTGSFDLRNVVGLSSAEDPGVKQGLTLLISESSKRSVTKRLTVSFAPSPAEQAAWTKLWASAVPADAVAAGLRDARDDYLALLFDKGYAEQEPKTSAPAYKVFHNAIILSPRVAPTAQLLENCKTASLLELDTPREAPPSGGAAGADRVRGSTTPPTPTSTTSMPTITEAAPLDTPSRPEAGAPAAEEDEEVMVVTVPDGVSAGDKLKVTAPDGMKILITVPPGATAGAQLEFGLPKVSPEEVRAQRKRSPSPEKSAGKRGPPPEKKRNNNTPAQQPAAEASPEHAAAVKMQSAVRGHAARYDQQEGRRQEWLQFYVAQREWEKARGLVCTPEEQEDYLEKRRAWLLHEWVKFHVSRGETTQAKAFGWDGRDPPAPPFCRCCVPASATLDKPPPLDESDRDSHFEHLGDAPGAEEAAVKMQSALRGKNARFGVQEESRIEWLKYYAAPDVAEWDKANELVCTDEEQQFVENSIRASGAWKSSWRDRESTDPEAAPEASVPPMGPPPGHGGPPASASGDAGGRGSAAKDAAPAAPAAPSPVSAPASGQGAAPGAGPGARATPADDPATKQAKFIAAIKGYDWEAAAQHAQTQQDLDDIKDSRSRVEHMHYHMHMGNKAQAHEYAITKSERQRIDEYVPSGKANKEK